MGTRVSATRDGSAPADSGFLTLGPIEGSTKHYLTVGDLRVPQRRIHLTNGEHLDVYDTSGPYTDPTARIDVEKGLAPTRDNWRRPEPVDGASTQLAWARAGIITEEMRFIAAREGIDPELVIREGEPVSEILAQIREDPDIGVLVLGAGTEKSGPGPLVSQMARASGSLPVPITIVPGDLSKEKLEAIT